MHSYSYYLTKTSSHVHSVPIRSGLEDIVSGFKESWAFHSVLVHCKKRKGIDSIWLSQFPNSSASLNTVESHCLLYIPTVIRVSRTLVNVMGE